VIIKVAKKMIAEAVENKITLIKIKDEYESEFAFHHNISFTQAVDRPIKFLSRSEQEVPSRTCLRLLASAMGKGYHVDHIPTNDTHALSPYLASLKFSQRHHQNLLFDNVYTSLNTEKCGLVEGGTGIGKTLAILANANELALQHTQRVVIATNTISNITQYLDTYNELLNAKHEMQPLQIILGRGTFVCTEKLLALLDDPQYKHYNETVNKWLKNGGTLESGDLLPPYQSSQIERLCPDIPKSEICLGLNDDATPGVDAYRNQFDLADWPSAIIICTHSMLCVDAKRRVFSKKSDDVSALAKKLQLNISKLVTSRDNIIELRDIKQKNDEIKAAITEKDRALGEALKGENIGSLPQYEFLIVDEAHLLESAMSDALSIKMSFRNIVSSAKRLVDAGKLASNAHVKLKAALQAIYDTYDEKTTEKIIGGDASPLKDATRAFCSAILNARGIKQCEEPWIDEVRQLQKHANSAGNANTYLSISYSPIRHYPQAIMGSTNTNMFLSTLWQQTTASCCVSATLYFKKYLDYSASHFIEILNIPPHKCMTFEPITPKWLKEPVTGFYLPPAGDDSFIPVSVPSDAKKEDVEAKLTKWHHNTAKQINEAYKTSAGGVLVLMTSFADAKVVSERLRGEISDIVVADGVHTLLMQKQNFLELSMAGKKPLWVALGAAWTGLDINGKHVGLTSDEISEMDNVLTDLIIPKIPFGLNMTLAHMIRKKKHYNKAKLEILDTAIRFKQGVGRLIRLEGQSHNRRIFLLDGRINDPKQKGFYSPILQYIDTFPRIKTIHSV
jgi:CRISPR type IV-associated DEAD/DEAH-box helicase Csf4